MAYYAQAQPGPSTHRQTLASSSIRYPSANQMSSSSSSSKAMQSSMHWNGPATQPLSTLDAFAWPPMWFQFPSPTATTVPQSTIASSSTPMFPYATDLTDCPELDRTFLSPCMLTPHQLTASFLHASYGLPISLASSLTQTYNNATRMTDTEITNTETSSQTQTKADSKTPESSPVSLYETCMTPSQDQDTPYVAICDVPLVAPRPLPFTPPSFLQFDHLPEEDEDLSFPPYTRSRRQTHSQNQEAQLSSIQDQIVTQTETLTHELEAITKTKSTAEKVTMGTQRQSALESRKRQRSETETEEFTSSRSSTQIQTSTAHGLHGVVPTISLPVPPQSHLQNQEHASKRRKLLPNTYPYPGPSIYTQPSIFLAGDSENSMWAPHREPFFVPQFAQMNLGQGVMTGSTNWA